ncbi:hypothetical protein [Gleimia coleocanis]|nr:hypothetical protein [Gleimia coleocanis]
MKTLQLVFIMLCIMPFVMLLPFSFYIVVLLLGVVLLLMLSSQKATNKEKQQLSTLITCVALSIVGFYWLFEKAIEQAESGGDSLLASIPTPLLLRL